MKGVPRGSLNSRGTPVIFCHFPLATVGLYTETHAKPLRRTETKRWLRLRQHFLFSFQTKKGFTSTSCERLINSVAEHGEGLRGTGLKKNSRAYGHSTNHGLSAFVMLINAREEKMGNKCSVLMLGLCFAVAATVGCERQQQ